MAQTPNMDSVAFDAGRHPSSVFPCHFGLIANSKPVRRLRRRGLSPSWDGQHSSQKALGPAVFESLLERDAQTLLSADPRIVSYAVQAHRLIYWAPNASGDLIKRQYTPDIVARDVDGQMLIIEVKARHFADGEAWQALEPCIREAYARDHGARLIVLRELEIRQQPRLDNAKLMLAYRGPPDDARAELLTQEALGALGDALDIDGISGFLESSAGLVRARTFAALMRLALRGAVTFDMSQQLTRRSKILRGLNG